MIVGGGVLVTFCVVVFLIGCFVLFICWGFFFNNTNEEMELQRGFLFRRRKKRKKHEKKRK